MIKALTNIFFKEILPWQVYGDTEDELMSHLLMDGSTYVCEQVERFFERNGYLSPYDEEDFTVEGGQVEKFMFLRVMLNNHKYTDVYGFYVLFDLDRGRIVRKSCYSLVFGETSHDFIDPVIGNKIFGKGVTILDELDQDAISLAYDYLDRFDLM